MTSVETLTDGVFRPGIAGSEEESSIGHLFVPPTLNSQEDDRYSFGSYDSKRDRHLSDIPPSDGARSSVSVGYEESEEELSASSRNESQTSFDTYDSATSASVVSQAPPNLDDTDRNRIYTDTHTEEPSCPVSPYVGPVDDPDPDSVSIISQISERITPSIITKPSLRSSKFGSVHRRLSQLKRSMSDATKNSNQSLTIETNPRSHQARFSEATSVYSPIDHPRTSESPDIPVNSTAPANLNSSKRSLRSTLGSRAGRTFKKWTERIGRVDSAGQVEDRRDTENYNKTGASEAWWNTLTSRSGPNMGFRTTRPKITHTTHDAARLAAPTTTDIPPVKPPAFTLRGLRDRLPSVSALTSGAYSLIGRLPQKWRPSITARTSSDKPGKPVAMPTYIPADFTSTNPDTGVRSDAIGGDAARRVSTQHRWSSGFSRSPTTDGTLWSGVLSKCSQAARSVMSCLPAVQSLWSTPETTKDDGRPIITVKTELDVQVTPSNRLSDGSSIVQGPSNTRHVSGLSSLNSLRRDIKKFAEAPDPTQWPTDTEDYHSRYQAYFTDQPLDTIKEFDENEPEPAISVTPPSDKRDSELRLTGTDIGSLAGGIFDSVSAPTSSDTLIKPSEASAMCQDMSVDEMFALSVAGDLWRGAVSRGECEPSRVGICEDESAIQLQRSIVDGFSNAALTHEDRGD